MITKRELTATRARIVVIFIPYYTFSYTSILHTRCTGSNANGTPGTSVTRLRIMMEARMQTRANSPANTTCGNVYRVNESFG